jgi:uncharacterized membrane protein YhaH (DUF805 family)
MTLVRLFFDSAGRINRAKYWLVMIAAACAASLPALLFGPLDSQSPASFLAYIGFVVAIALALTAPIKRLQDRGKHGPYWLALYYFGPVVLLLIANVTGNVGLAANVASAVFLAGALALLAWMVVDLGCLRGTAGPNEHGADPRGSR